MWQKMRRSSMRFGGAGCALENLPTAVPRQLLHPASQKGRERHCITCQRWPGTASADRSLERTHKPRGWLGRWWLAAVEVVQVVEVWQFRHFRHPVSRASVHSYLLELRPFLCGKSGPRKRKVCPLPGRKDPEPGGLAGCVDHRPDCRRVASGKVTHSPPLVVCR